MHLLRDVPLAPLTTFQLGGSAAAFAEVSSAAEIPELVEESRRLGLPIFPLGGGSNVIVSDGPVRRLVLKMAIPGIEVASGSLLRVGAGVPWDDAVAFAAARGLAGVEALTAIPGTAGAAPVQNIGAYGAELADVLESVEAYDAALGRHVTLGRVDCAFGYRDSVFKRERGRYVITGVALRLRPEPPAVPRYPGMAERLPADPTCEDVRREVAAVRWSKLPKPAELPNVGSFFENPVVDAETLARLLLAAPDAPHFPANGGEKVPAGWLVERAGLKGASLGPVGVYERNALVLVNRGGATFRDVLAARDEVARAVRVRFGVELRMEPEIVA